MTDTLTEKEFDRIAFTNLRWEAGLDSKDVNLALVCEAIDFREIDRKYEGKPYPVAMECSVLVHPKHMSKKYKHKAKESMSGDTIFDLASYGGGVPVTDFLEGTKSSARSHVKSKIERQPHVTFGHEIKVRWFKDTDDALQYADDVYKHNADALFTMIGFKLDQPVNRMGTTGWEIIKSQVTGKHWMD